MEDVQIIDLYWARDQLAITASAEKYGGYCTAVARNILDSLLANSVWLDEDISCVERTVDTLAAEYRASS